MASTIIKQPTEVVTGTNVITTTHNLYSTNAVRLGKLYVINLNLKLVSNVAQWGTIGTLKNVAMPTSIYVAGYTNDSSQMFYIGSTGDISCATSSLVSGKDVKIAIPLILS